LAQITAEQAAWLASDLVGGAPFLDFANTVAGRTKSREADRLTSYPTLVAWAQAAAIVSPAEANSLLTAAAANEAAAARGLQDARAFRESLYRLLSRVAAGGAPQGQDLDQVNDSIANAAAAARLTWAGNRFVASIGVEKAGLAIILCRVALSAQRFLDGEALDRLRECRRCSWLFLDRSKNGRRRWCRMDACGNRAKAARHYRKNG
jgi:predicted RNA-binding Zn ribbon-like protein